MSTRWERRGAGSTLWFKNPQGIEVPVPAPPNGEEATEAAYTAKGFVLLSRGAAWEPVSNSGAKMPGDREVDCATGAVIRTLTERLSVEVGR
jgi:hypothetical protein